MMARLITAPPAALARLLNGRPLRLNEAWVAITVQGILKGYSWAAVKWLCQQAALESGWGEAATIQADFNPWGMSRVTTRPTTQLAARESADGVNTIGLYSSVWSAAKDRLLWDEYFGTDTFKGSAEAYAEAVADSYHPSSDYSASVSSVDTTAIDRAMFATVIVLPLEVGALLKIGS